MSPRILIIPAMLLSIFAGLHEAHSQTEPPNRIRVTAEEETVTVRVYDEDNSQTISIGAGFVVSDDETDIVIATAGHVISAASPDVGFNVEVRFFHRGVWCETKSFVVKESHDFAYITVDRHLSPYDHARRADSLPVTTAGDGAVWALGYDHADERLNWRQLFTTSEEAGQITLRGRGLAQGFSGGLIVSPAGRVGMLTDRGPGHSGHKAISCGTLASILESDGLTSHLSRNVATDALQHALDNGLTIGMYTLDYSTARRDHMSAFWAVLELQGIEDGAFVGRAMTCHSPKSTPLLRLFPESTIVRGEFALTHEWPSNGRGRLDARAVEYQVDPKLTTGELLALRADTPEAVTYLMIPHAATELLAARAMLDAVPPRSDFVEWPTASTLSMRIGGDLSRDGVDPVFSHVFSDREGGGVLEFRLPTELVAGMPVTISWTPLMTQKNVRWAEREDGWVNRLSATSVTVETGDGTILGSAVLGQDGEISEIRLSKVPDETLVLRFENTVPLLTNGRDSMLTMLRVEYDALK